MAWLETFDALLLARLQFAFTVSFHIIFPAFSIGLASYLAVLEALWLGSGTQVYLNLFNYWKTIFAVAFGMGVVSGIVMSYQFGTNWSVFSDKAGPVIGPLMGYEVLTAFFLEAGFLGVMLFGLPARRPGPALLRHAHGRLRHADLGHLDPRGQQLDADARRLRRSTRPASSCPSTGGRSSSTRPSPIASSTWCSPPILTTAFVVGAVGAWHLLRDTDARAVAHHVLDGHVDGGASSRRSRSSPATCTASTRWSTSRPRSRPWRATTRPSKGAPLILFGLPDMDAETTRYAIEIPKLGSFILTHDLGWRGQGPESLARRPTGPTALIVVLDASASWSASASLMLAVGLWSSVAALAQARLYDAALAAPRRRRHGPCRLRRRARRLDHHRGRPPALHGLWPAAHGRIRLAHRRARRRRLAHRLHHRLFPRLRRRHASTCCA